MNWDKVQDNPWMYDTINKWLWDIREQTEEGAVYLIEATMRNYRYWGKAKLIYKL